MTTDRTNLPVVGADILEKYFQLFLETSKAQMDYSATTTLKCTVTREMTDMCRNTSKHFFRNLLNFRGYIIATIGNDLFRQLLLVCIYKELQNVPKFFYKDKDFLV